jgi:hypothetical protein
MTCQDAYLDNPAFRGLEQIALDATSLSAFKACPRRYELSIIRGWRHENADLSFGSFLHAGREAYLKQRWCGLSHESALDAALAHTFALITSEDGLMWTSDKPTKRADTLIQALVLLCDHFANDPLETVTIEGKPAIEYSFALPFGDRTICGHIDRIARDTNGRIYGIDLKSTEGELNAAYARQWSPHNQMSLYTWAIGELTGCKGPGMMIEAVQTLVNTTRVTRIDVSRTPSCKTEWTKELDWWIDSMYVCAKSAYWPQNDTACKLCQFREICSTSPAHRDALLHAGFVRRQWNPLELRT